MQQAATKQPSTSNVTFEDRIISEQIFGPILPDPEPDLWRLKLKRNFVRQAGRPSGSLSVLRKGSKRVTVAVSEDVFSRVSHLTFSRELDKIDILTFLLHRHSRELSAEKIPKWLSAQSNGPNRIDFLSFVQTPDLAKTIAILQARARDEQGRYSRESCFFSGCLAHPSRSRLNRKEKNTAVVGCAPVAKVPGGQRKKERLEAEQRLKAKMPPRRDKRSHQGGPMRGF